MSRFVLSWSRPFRLESHRVSRSLRNVLRSIEVSQLHGQKSSFFPAIKCFFSTSSLASEIESTTSTLNSDISYVNSFQIDAKGNLLFSLEQKDLLESVLRPLYNYEKAQLEVKEKYGISKGFWLQIIAKFRKVVISRPYLIFNNDASKMEMLLQVAREAQKSLQFQNLVESDDETATTVKDESDFTGIAAVRSPVPSETAASNNSPLTQSEIDIDGATFAGITVCNMQNLASFCIPYVVNLANGHFPAQMAFATSLRDSADLRSPHTWYPVARSMKRKIIYHAGPTNSGKTYNAIQALKNAWSGVYCGPLRLLALEVFESLNQDGVYTSLLTGQEKKVIPFGEHVSCTIEMVDTEKKVDVAVIDEIQMIGDETRGASWTRALLGVPAKEVHVCGDPAAIPAVSAICAITGDDFEVKHYERLTAINPLNESLGGDYSKIEEGDAIVAFSRKDIYAIRKAVEKQTMHKCCVVYGSLPPETRSAQARLFNDPNSGYRVLVASDAIGMGLNLNIRRVVFHTMRKFDGQTTGPVSLPMVKQIAGRAGRRNSIYPEGFSTTLHDEDLPYLHSCVGTPTEPITHAGLFPDPEQLRSFSAVLPPGTPLSKIISEFLTACQLEGPYFMCRSEDMESTAELLQPYPLTLEQRSNLCLAPANLRNVEIRRYFLNYVDQYVSGQPVRLNVQLPIDDPLYLSREIESLEAKASALDIYLWMYSKLGSGSFPDVQEAITKRAIASGMLESSLMQLSENTKGIFEAKLRRQKRKLRLQSAELKPSKDKVGSVDHGSPNVVAVRSEPSKSRNWKFGPLQVKRSKSEKMSS